MAQNVALQFTNIKEEDIEDFLKYCNLPDEKIESSSDYDLALTMRECYQSYIN